MNNSVNHLVIVGGGSAGWLTAGILAAQHQSHSQNGLKITVIESSEIPSIGVGEGTWPTMRDTLSLIGISESDFIACCDASFKQGSEFIGWRTDQEPESYYHPFMLPNGYGKSDLVKHWSTFKTDISFAHAYCPQATLCDHGKAPKQIQTPDYAAVANYGYHLDAGKFAELLRTHCVDNLGVKLIDDKVCAVIGEPEQAIEAVVTENNGEVQGDIFVDCSGQHALLIEKHYNVPFKSQKHILFNDAAIAVQVPYADKQDPICSQTRSTAYDDGWVWDIGLPSRKGMGFVYNSERLSENDAREQLISHLNATNPHLDMDSLKFKAIRFNPGYRQEFWKHNCLAIGMSAGFIEPLEASALALIELSAKMLAKELPANKDIMAISAKRFNARFDYRWQRIIDFLKLHYVLSERQSEYWMAHKSEKSQPEQLKELLQLWQYQPPSFNDLIQIEEIFPAASYQYVLYGMGFNTQIRPTDYRFDDPATSDSIFQECRQVTDKYLSGLPDNRSLIEQIVAKYQQQRAS